MAPQGPWIALVGPGRDAAKSDLAHAEDAGAAVAEAGAVLVCGGLGGVMEAACRGARSRGGLTIGLLPGDDREDANGWVVLALRRGVPVLGVRTWELGRDGATVAGVRAVDDAQTAVAEALRLARSRGG